LRRAAHQQHRGRSGLAPAGCRADAAAARDVGGLVGRGRGGDARGAGLERTGDPPVRVAWLPRRGRQARLLPGSARRRADSLEPSALVTIDRAALPFVALAALPAIAAALTGWLWIALILLVLPVAVALFFRDPERQSPADRALVLSPADGRVMHAGPARPLEAPPGDWLQVTIFLSVFDVHINRTPVAGRVERVEYVPGTFRAAFRHDSHENERSEIWIDHDGVPVVV